MPPESSHTTAHVLQPVAGSVFARRTLAWTTVIAFSGDWSEAPPVVRNREHQALFRRGGSFKTP